MFTGRKQVGKITYMIATQMDRMVMVPARALDDLCSMAELAANMRADEIQFEDSLVNGLRGSVREVRCRASLYSRD